MPRIFPVTVGALRFHPVSFARGPLLTSLRCLEGLEYSLQCQSPSNSYQLNSTFDAAVKRQLLASGGREISFTPRCAASIDLDLALDPHGNKVVFEIEKANKEKLLYDFLKMHIYLHDPEISAAVLVVPVNWAHTGGMEDLFSLARERFDLCSTYGMADPSKMQRMLIVGVTQLYQGRPIDNATLRVMKQECGVYFKTPRTVESL